MALIDNIRSALGSAWHVGQEKFYSNLLPAVDGTAEASKVVTADASQNVTLTGTLTAGAVSAPQTGVVTASALHVDTGTKTAAATTGAATLNKMAGVITSEALTTAAGADYTLTLTDSDIAATDQVMASVQLGSATTGTPAVATVTPGAGSVVIVIQNIHATAALNGTIKISFVVLKN